MNILKKYPEKFFWRAFYVSLVVSLILDFLWLYTHTFHYHFSFQNIPQFFALFGVIGCMGLILIAKGMGYFIVTDEDYYDRQSRR